MAVTAVVLARDRGQHVHLAAVKRAIGDGNAQHVRMKLQVEAVHQAQWLELILGQIARDPARDLVAEFGHAGVDDRLVVSVVFVH